MERSHDQCVEAPASLPAFKDLAPPDRYCDLILTGGVTSAVAYPPAIFALATVYRLRSLGGSSSGAGSAALAAAAEYRRRHGSPEGFRLLLERTAQIADTTQRKTNLRWLFQPGPGKKRLFSVLVKGVAKPGHRLLRFGTLLIATYFLAPLLVVLAVAFWVVCMAQPEPVWACVMGVLALIVGVSLGVVWLGIDLHRMLNDGYGLCSGLERVRGAKHPPLTQWLHDVIQELAGRPESAPLTFADLETAPGAPSATLGTRARGDEVAIKLQMFTANLTLSRPYLFPLADDAPEAEGALYFLESEMRDLFPASVVAHMVKVSTQYAEATPYPLRRAALHEPFWRMPGRQLPILVAARMSVSFPVLFKAVPLWTVERKRAPRQPDELRMRRCLFADGGFCSNFPIHLFDSAVPDWPTFGIALRDLIHDKQSDVESQKKQMIDSIQLPEHHHHQIEEAWQDFDEQTGLLGRLGGFVGAMLAAVKDWNDATVARLPGVRDRVVRLGLAPGIGGLNILMTGQQIRALAIVGGEAARRLIERFSSPGGPDGLARGWTEHRWVRFNILRECLTESLAGFGASAAAGKYAKPLGEQIDAAQTAAPLAGGTPSQLLASQAAALQGVLGALQEAERALSASVADQPYEPYPRPDLRIRPPL